MSSHKIKYNEALVEKPPLKKHQKALIAANGLAQAANDGSFHQSAEDFMHEFWQDAGYDFDSAHGKVGADHMEFKIHDPSLKERKFSEGAGSKTATGQHAASVQRAKSRAVPGFFNQGGKPDFGDHAKTIKVDWLDDVPGLEPVGSSSINQKRTMSDAASYLAHESVARASGFMDYVDGVNSARDSTIGMFKHMASHPLDTLTTPVVGAWNVASHPILSYQNAVHSTTDFMESFANASGAERLGMTLSVAGNGIYGSAFGAGARIGIGKAYSSYGKTWQSPIHFDISGMGSTLNSGIDLSRLKFRSILPKHVPGSNYAHNRLQLEALKTEYRQQASWVNPSEIKHAKLNAIVDNLYRPGAKYGSGSTADGLRLESAHKGFQTGGRDHFIKANNNASAIEKLLKTNVLSPNERMIAENVRLDLLDSIGERLWYSQTSTPSL